MLGNSVVIGSQKAAFRVQEDSTISYYLNGSSMLFNCFLHDQANVFASADKFSASDKPYSIPGFPVYDLSNIKSTYTDTKTTEVTDFTSLGLTDPFNVITPNVNPSGSSKLLSGSDFTPSKLADSFFEKVAFIGAIGSTDWTSGWVKWGL